MKVESFSCNTFLSLRKLEGVNSSQFSKNWENLETLMGLYQAAIQQIRVKLHLASDNHKYYLHTKFR